VKCQFDAPFCVLRWCSSPPALRFETRASSQEASVLDAGVRVGVAIECCFEQPSCVAVFGYRFRVKREQPTRVERLSLGSQGQNLAFYSGLGSKDPRTGGWRCHERDG